MCRVRLISSVGPPDLFCQDLFCHPEKGSGLILSLNNLDPQADLNSQGCHKQEVLDNIMYKCNKSKSICQVGNSYMCKKGKLSDFFVPFRFLGQVLPNQVLLFCTKTYSFIHSVVIRPDKPWG